MVIGEFHSARSCSEEELDGYIKATETNVARREEAGAPIGNLPQGIEELKEIKKERFGK